MMKNTYKILVWFVGILILTFALRYVLDSLGLPDFPFRNLVVIVGPIFVMAGGFHIRDMIRGKPASDPK